MKPPIGLFASTDLAGPRVRMYAELHRKAHDMAYICQGSGTHLRLLLRLPLTMRIPVGTVETCKNNPLDFLRKGKATFDFQKQAFTIDIHKEALTIDFQKEKVTFDFPKEIVTFEFQVTESSHTRRTVQTLVLGFANDCLTFVQGKQTFAQKRG